MRFAPRRGPYNFDVPVVTLRSPLRDLAGGSARVRVPGATVGEALRELERAHPPITGWILDEHGRIRRHVNVFRGGDQAGADTPVEDEEVLHVLSAISGGEG
jgi:molybdopterin converting factor small subunit